MSERLKVWPTPTRNLMASRINVWLTEGQTAQIDDARGYRNRAEFTRDALAFYLAHGSPIPAGRRPPIPR